MREFSATILLQYRREIQSPEQTLTHGIRPLKVDLRQALPSHRIFVQQ